SVSMLSDKNFIKKFETEAGDGISKEELIEIFDHKGFKNVYLVKGFIPDIFSDYFKQNPATQIALLHIDVDVYETTKSSLEYLYEKVVKGGIIIFDDYGQIDGATKAINEFIKSLGKKENIIQKIPYNYIPAFLVKE
ncbi:MAG: TylF/MycF family methyltransferase, partial [Clostridiales bacterium]|nr:TylF/MycF family methyltransferase [Clostridiales bacterium]